MAGDQTLACVVVRYHLGEGAVASITQFEKTSYWIERGYLHLGNSEASGPVEKLLARAREGRGWLAQAGTMPVCVDGVWGGRNYPEIRVEADELVRVLEGAEVGT